MLACLVLPALGLTAWSRRQLHDVERFVATVSPLGRARWLRTMVARRGGRVAALVLPYLWPRAQRQLHRRLGAVGVLGLAGVAVLTDGAGQRRLLAWLLATGLVGIALAL